MPARTRSDAAPLWRSSVARLTTGSCVSLAAILVMRATTRRQMSCVHRGTQRMT